MDSKKILETFYIILNINNLKKKKDGSTSFKNNVVIRKKNPLKSKNAEGKDYIKKFNEVIKSNLSFCAGTETFNNSFKDFNFSFYRFVVTDNNSYTSTFLSDENIAKLLDKIEEVLTLQIGVIDERDSSKLYPLCYYALFRVLKDLTIYRDDKYNEFIDIIRLINESQQLEQKYEGDCEDFTYFTNSVILSLKRYYNNQTRNSSLFKEFILAIEDINAIIIEADLINYGYTSNLNDTTTRHIFLSFKVNEIEYVIDCVLDVDIYYVNKRVFDPFFYDENKYTKKLLQKMKVCNNNLIKVYNYENEFTITF
jgi:hypothetical protein